MAMMAQTRELEESTECSKRVTCCISIIICPMLSKFCFGSSTQDMYQYAVRTDSRNSIVWRAIMHKQVKEAQEVSS